LAGKSEIEWTDTTWNPVTGCTKISSGCVNCYAERIAHRLKAMGNKRYKNGFRITMHPDLVEIPMKWRTPRVVFVNSMSDLFHEEVPFDFIKKVFETMNKCPHHTFQVLTKRSKRLVEVSALLRWTSNIWMGVTVEDSSNIFRIDDLLRSDASVKFISCEPLIGEVHFPTFRGIDWVIVGGESGPNARPMKKEWAISIRDLCVEEGIPYFFKQWGGLNRKENGRILDGTIWNQMPRLSHRSLPEWKNQRMTIGKAV
jgi:protein gp37